MAQRLSMDQVGGERLQPFHPSEWPKVAGPVHLGLLLGKNGPGELGLDVVGAILMIESLKTRPSAEVAVEGLRGKRDQQRSKDD
jgi:hypothetical protein